MQIYFTNNPVTQLPSNPAGLGASRWKRIRKNRFILLFSFYGAGDEEYNHALYQQNKKQGGGSKVGCAESNQYEGGVQSDQVHAGLCMI